MEENELREAQPIAQDPQQETPKAQEQQAEIVEAEAPEHETPEEAVEEILAPEETPAADWAFGGAAPAPKKRAGKGFFFAMFGGVTLLCAALLFLTLWLGNSGFRITKTTNIVRTVFVHDTDEAGEMLSPAEAAEVVRRSSVTVVYRGETTSGHGSGFIYSADGYIVTNAHVVEDATFVQVILADGQTFEAGVIGVDDQDDIAVLKIDAEGLPAVTLGSSASVLVGESVLAVGTPARVDYAGTTTFGRVSEADRIFPVSEGTSVSKKMHLIQMDATVNPGNSGGPLADMYGRVIGIVVMKVTYYNSTIFDGLGFAIPIDGAKPIIEALIRDGTFEGHSEVSEGRSLIGIIGHGVAAGNWYQETESGAQKAEEGAEGAYYITVNGVYVSSVTGEAVLGKLQVGDVITHVDGYHVFDVTELIAAVNRRWSGEEITLTVRRGEDTLEITVVLSTE